MALAREMRKEYALIHARGLLLQLDSTTTFVEHPEVVADRICQAVEAVGDRTRVIASVDCSFGTFAGTEAVAESVVWAKLHALREGADLATRRLWG
jgi:5-methyltetrahydropteroyltriglutamate--homocysteine methyltransferase